MEEIKVIVQIGRTQKGFGHLAILFVKFNGKQVSWENTEGEWATSYAEKDRQLWFVAELRCSPKDLIEIQSFVKTNRGVDEKNTWKRVYEVDSDVEVEEINDRALGHKSFPIIKGKVKEVMSASKHDKRMDEVLSLFDSIESF